jgi:GTP-binding protein
MAPPLQLTFVRSATLVSQLPPTAGEVAFVGRSNVGKSSLINALAHHRQLAQVSNTPGRTRLLNLFSLPNGRTLMDLPGYGYAKVNKAAKDEWGPMIEAYLLEREELRMVAVLVDGAIGPTKLDVQMLDWLRFHEVPHTVVATKHDQVRPAQLGRRRAEVAAGCQLELGDVVWVSASKGTNIENLRGLVLSWLT